jgi:hypothetical protein
VRPGPGLLALLAGSVALLLFACCLLLLFLTRDRLKDSVDLDTVQADLAGVVRQALEPAHASVWVSQEGAPRSPRADDRGP